MKGEYIMKVLLCIDDTDNLESIGTGEVLENLCSELENTFKIQTSFVSRHQLYIHEDIAYTSHNSSMCSELELEKSKFDEILDYSKAYLTNASAQGSDPGLCMVSFEGFEGIDELVAFGKKAKKEVLNKSDAYDLAKRYSDHIFLSEHGGTGDGVIGALAGCGLRNWGMDGKIKGKIKPDNPAEILSVKQFCSKYHIHQVLDATFKEVASEDLVLSGAEIKAILWNHQPAVVVVPNDDLVSKWKIMNKKELKKYKIGQ